jgi:hypothetical protein
LFVALFAIPVRRVAGSFTSRGKSAADRLLKLDHVVTAEEGDLVAADFGRGGRGYGTSASAKPGLASLNSAWEKESAWSSVHEDSSDSDSGSRRSNASLGSKDGGEDDDEKESLLTAAERQSALRKKRRQSALERDRDAKAQKDKEENHGVALKSVTEQQSILAAFKSRLAAGFPVSKHGRRGKPSHRTLCAAAPHFAKIAVAKGSPQRAFAADGARLPNTMYVCDISQIRQGAASARECRTIREGDQRADRCVSVVFTAAQSLNLECADAAEANSVYEGLTLLKLESEGRLQPAEEGAAAVV